MESIKQILMRRDGLTPSEAEEIIEEMKERVRQGDDPEEVLYEDVGLEPDYIFDIL